MTLEIKNTLNLPKTSFSMKANLPQREPEMLRHWEKIDIYGKIRKARAGSPGYVLHDGPPYANGAIHMGHCHQQDHQGHNRKIPLHDGL